MASASVKITDGADDGHYDTVIPTCDMTGTAVRVGTVAFMSTVFHGGLRFPNVNVPQGVTLDTATITVQVTSVNGTPEFTIFGNDVDDAPTWSDVCAGGNRPGDMGAKTTASVSPSVVSVGQKSFDVKSICQEIIDRPGFGGAIRFSLENDKAPGSAHFILFEAEEFGVPTYGAAQLDLTWTPVEYIMPVHGIESVDLEDGAPRVFPYRHVGGGSTYKREEGFCGVQASLAADAEVYLRFKKLGDTLPSGTPYAYLLAQALATSGKIDAVLDWAALAEEEDPSAATFNTEGQQTITWASGDSGVYKKMEWALNVVAAPAANDRIVARITFKSTSTLAVRSVWHGWVDYH